MYRNTITKNEKQKKTFYEKPNQNVTVNCDNLCLKADTEGAQYMKKNYGKNKKLTK